MDILKNISIIFLSVFFESLPFLISGSLISSLIENFISNDKIAKIMPKNIILGSIVGVFLGFFIPEGSDKTLGCYTDDVRFSYWNMDGYEELVQYLEKEK